MTRRLESLVSSSALAPLMPVLYIAWADGGLAEAECTRIREIADALPALDDADHQTLTEWLTPDSPPRVDEMAHLRRRIRERVKNRQPSLAAMSAALHAGRDPGLAEAVDAYAREHSVSGVGVSAEIFQDAGEPVEMGFDEIPAPFNPSAIQAVLEGDYARQWDDVRKVLAHDIFVYADNETDETKRARVLRWLEHLAEHRDIATAALPPSVGGQGDMAGFIHVFTALAMFDLSLVVKFGVQFGLFGGSIIFLGNEAHHKRYLPDVASLALLGGFAMTESGHGSNVQELETTASYDAERQEFVIDTPSVSARKEWIGNAARDGHAATVFAQLKTGGESYGVHAFVVPIRDENGAPMPGVRIEDCGNKMGLNGVDNGRLYFDGVRIPRENLLDRYGQVAPDGTYDSPIANDNKRFFVTLGTLVGGRISVASACVTAAKKSLTIATRYATLRRQFGGEAGGELRILDYRTHQVRLFPKIAHTYALHFAVEDLVDRFKHRTEDTAREVETLAAGLKAMASWNAIDASQQARECCGGLGFLSENQIANIRRDIDVFATFEGDNIVLLNLVAKNRLARYAKSFEQDLVMTIARELAARARTELLEANPVIVRKTDEDHLRDVEFHLEVLKLRAHNLLVSAARRLRKRISDGMDAYLAFTDVQDHVMAFARAEMDHHIASCFAAVIERQPPGASRDALETMRELAVLDTLHADAGWYLENGYFSASKSKAIRKLRLRLLEQIRPDALAYVQAFAIPDELLSAPIAFPDYIGRAPLKRDTGSEPSPAT
ncbi:acyl-CoA dehydrogenase [Salinisphaera sp. T31B1]|uniref:acyl-CoA dehydrogenase family protein n=1 Tax=Salinisphaera sp. T31B1 TaxID=727963 RepID=UPI003342B0F5